MRKRNLIPLIVACLGLSSCSNDLVPINPGQEIEYVDLSAESLSLEVGESATLTAVASDQQEVTWVNNDSTVVRLEAKGNTASIVGLAKGTAQISAFRKGQSAICVVTVGGGNAEQPITIVLSPSSKELNINDEFVLSASVSGSTNPVTFSSTDSSVATVEAKSDTTARVKALSEGLATIIAKVGTKTASCSVTVMDPSSDVYIALDRQSLQMTVGTTDALQATVRPSGAQVQWASTDPSVATVSNGTINALSVGSTTISATVTADGQNRTATCQVSVIGSGGDTDYDDQIAAWSQPGHLYLHYLRKTDSDYEKWAVWAWPNYPDDGEGSLWGASKKYEQKGIDYVSSWGWMSKADCGGTGTEAYSDQHGQVMDIILDQSKAPGGQVVGGRSGNECPLIADYLWDDPLFLKAAIGFLIVDQTKMDGSDMWTSDGGAESYIKKIGKLMPDGKNGYLHVYCVEGSVSDFTTSSGAQVIPENPTATDTTGNYRSQNDINNLKYDAYPNGVATSTSFLDDRPGTGYQIFVPSFCDSDGDGYGDIKGITSKLDYLDDLGIDVLWLTPIQESNSYHGYDVTDYYKIDQRFGTLRDYQELIYKAHAKGMKVLMDMVINHTSKSNVLYKKSQRAEPGTLPNGKQFNYRDMYLWKYKGDKILEWDGIEKYEWDPQQQKEVKVPFSENNPANFITKNVEESADWYRDGTSNYYYYGKFGSGMAELNYSCSATREYMTDMCKYWLSFGLDGFRLDAIKHIYLLSELDPSYNYSGDYVTYDAGYRKYFNPELDREITVMNDYSYDRDLNVKFWKQFAGTIKSAYPNCFLVGENFDGWNQRIAPFYEAIDSQFDFSTYYHLNESTVTGGITSMGGDITKTLAYNAGYRSKAINGAFTSNHDVARLLNHAAANSTSTQSVEVTSSNYQMALERARWFAAVTILTPGLSWIYYGDEIGLCGNMNDKVSEVDDHGNNTDRWYRQPMRWSNEYGKDGVVKYGFSGLDVLWDKISAATPIVSAQQADNNSLYNYFKALCHVKGDSRFPTYGSFDWTGTIGGDTNTLSMKISDGSRSVIVFINASSSTKTVEANNRGPIIGGSYGTTANYEIPAFGFLVVQK